MTTYKLEPAGHDAPDIVKRTYSPPDRRLQLKFEEWLEKETPRGHRWELNPSFQVAEQAISNLEVNVDEAHGLLIQYQDHPQIVEAGLFLSAIYNQQPDNTIVYDIETPTPIDWIGCSLAERKTLTLNAQSGNWTGERSSGIVIVNAQSGHNTGERSSGIVITNAQSGDYVGHGSSGIVITNAQSGNCTGLYSSGILLARTKPNHIGENKARVLLPEDIKANKQLDEYLTKLCETTKALRTVDDIVAFKEQYGPNPQKGIEEDIKSLLKGRLFETIKKFLGIQ